MLEDISKISDVIRKKYAALRNRTRDKDLKIEQSLKPVTEPLAQLIRAKKNNPESSIVIPLKDQGKIKSPLPSYEEDDDDEASGPGLPTSPPPQPPRKRKSYHKATITPHRASTRASEIYGIRDVNGRKYIGNQEISTRDREIILRDGTRYIRTPGLMTLLTSKNPLEYEYNKTDLDDYRDILERTYAHRINYDPWGAIRKESSYKYKNIIRPLFSSGGGIQLDLNNKKVEYRYWDDANELVDRLILLHGSKLSGHSGHHNETESIVDELRERGVIE